jgi:hypothetical protein
MVYALQLPHTWGNNFSLLIHREDHRASYLLTPPLDPPFKALTTALGHLAIFKMRTVVWMGIVKAIQH